MSRIAWHRPPRVHPPALPDSRLSIAAPPQLPTNQPMSTWMTLLLPLLSSVSIAAYMLTYRKPLTTALGIGIVVLSIVVTLGARHQMRSSTRRTLERHRARYAAHLRQVRASSREVAVLQWTVADWQHPAPERLWAIADGRRRVWERRPGDSDFMAVRVGLGKGPIVTPLQLTMRNDPGVEYEPQCMAAAERLVETHGTVAGQPALVDLAGAGVVSVLGPAAQARATARALLTQLAVLQAPEDVTIAVCTSGNDAEWNWVTWLPHAQDTASPDSGTGQNAPGESGTATDHGHGLPAAPLVATDFGGIADVIERELTRARTEAGARTGLMSSRTVRPSRHVVLLVDDYAPASAWGRSALARELLTSAGPAHGITVVTVVDQESHEPSRVDVRIRVAADGALTLEGRDPSLHAAVEEAVADLPELELCEATARALAPLLLSDAEELTLARTVSLSELLGTEDLAGFDPTDYWVKPGENEVLRIPLGSDGDGTDLVLDLKESAHGGMGPHGLIVGATGSGKSELLRTLVTGLVMTHSPEQLSLVLVDFKGGATFAGFTGLPHVAGLITNLADDLNTVDRVRDALIGEQQRRQQILRDAGNVDSLRDYQIRQAAGGTDTAGRPLRPLPHLLVIVDEFGELLANRPDFIQLFVQIGRVGRSLGIHLLLATQRVEEGRLRGLESHLSYRICLRTFSAAESRAVIGTVDAYKLPPIPGSAYLKVDESLYRRFRVAHVSAPFDDGSTARHDEDGERPAPVLLGLRAPAAEAVEPAEPRRTTGRAPVTALPGPTQMEVIVERLQQFGAPVHQVWLPPLPEAFSLDSLLGPSSVQEERGLQAHLWPFNGQLRFPVGVVDIPLRQQQEPLVLDFGRTHPHLALVGAPQSGKSTLLRTAMLSAMLTHTPDEIQFSCLDYGGGSLRSLADAPHVSGVAGRHEPGRARRVLAEARRLIDERETLFRDKSVGSVSDFRALRRLGHFGPDTRVADLVVVIDNWGAVRGDLDEADALVLDIAGRGPGVGVHLLLAANRWADIRINLRDSVSARLELHLNDSAESEVDRRMSKLVPAGIPGRGAAVPGYLYQAALPRMDGRETATDLGEALQKTVTGIAGAWPGRQAPRVRELPPLIRLSELAGAATTADSPDAAGGTEAPGVIVGIAEHDLAPVRLDLAGGDQHLLVIGDTGAGKSGFLRTWMRGLAERHSAREARFLLVDYRRSLGECVPAGYIGACATNATQAADYARRLAGTLAERLPAAQLTARQLRDRSWWDGPDLYLVVDDYDLVADGRNSPLQPLLEYAAQGREIGFHIVVARRSGGMSRAAMTDPLITRVRELGAAGLLLSSDPREGVLLGNRRGAAMPPGRGVLVRRQEGDMLVQIAVGDDEERPAE